jgi:peptide/nickel transport system substrate-binding protein
VLPGAGPHATGAVDDGRAGSPPAATQAPQPFTLRVAITNLQATLDSQAIIGQNPRRYGLWDALLNQDENGKIIPGLASEWKNINPTTWQFKLAPGRKFSDGSAVTADDVKFSWDRAINPANKLGITSRLGTLDKAEIVDPQTVNLITKAPDALLTKRVAAVIIMSKAWAEKLQPADFTVKANGTGPYMVKEFVPGDHITVVPNPKSPVKAVANEVLIRQVPEASARIAGLRSGELDLIANLPIDQADAVKSAGFQLLNFNQGSTRGANIFLLPGSPTENVLVRQALNYAVDKDAIVKNIYKGYTEPTGQLVQKTTVGYNPNIKPYPFDQAKAKQLLAQAGYPNGFKMKVDLYITTPETQAMFLFIQDEWKQIGIETEFSSSTDPQFNTDRFYGLVQRAPILTAGLMNSPAMDADYAISWFSGKIPEPQRWYSNPDFDEAYQASLSELDEAKRSALLQKALLVLHDDAPFLYLIDNFSLWAASPNLDNVIVRGDSEPRFDLITKK